MLLKGLDKCSCLCYNDGMGGEELAVKQADMRLRNEQVVPDRFWARKKRPKCVSSENKNANLPIYAHDFHSLTAGVYLVGSSSLGWYKIGKSTRVKQRLANYRSLPFALDTELIWYCGENVIDIVERYLHRRYRSKNIRVNGTASEWFALTAAQVASVSGAVASFIEKTKAKLKLKPMTKQQIA
jgi:hypothetical protein